MRERHLESVVQQTERDADGKFSFCRGQVQEDFSDRTDAVLSAVKCRRCSKAVLRVAILLEI